MKNKRLIEYLIAGLIVVGLAIILLSTTNYRPKADEGATCPAIEDNGGGDSGTGTDGGNGGEIPSSWHWGVQPAMAVGLDDQVGSVCVSYKINAYHPPLGHLKIITPTPVVAKMIGIERFESCSANTGGSSEVFGLMRPTAKFEKSVALNNTYKTCVTGVEFLTKATAASGGIEYECQTDDKTQVIFKGGDGSKPIEVRPKTVTLGYECDEIARIK